jgi:hypothetical protein
MTQVQWFERGDLVARKDEHRKIKRGKGSCGLIHDYLYEGEIGTKKVIWERIPSKTLAMR